MELEALQASGGQLDGRTQGLTLYPGSGSLCQQLSVTLTNTQEDQFIRQKGSFCFMVSEDSVHACLFPWPLDL